MQATVLEFTLNGGLYCFDTEHVEYVFDLEEFYEVKGLHSSVKGIAKYNKDILVLVDTAFLYSGDGLDFETEKSVVVVTSPDGKYGMIVDEIIKIDNVEKIDLSLEIGADDVVINHYKEKNDLLNEIDPIPLLKKFNIPAIQNLNEEQSLTKKEKSIEKESYLVFGINGKLFAIKSIYVKEVLDNESSRFDINKPGSFIEGAIALRNEIVPLIDFEEKSSTKDLLVLYKNGVKLALDIDIVFDIEELELSKIESIECIDGKKPIRGFYNLNNKVVAIINEDYYFSKYVTEEQKNSIIAIQNSLHTDRVEYILFSIGKTHYAIELNDVRKIAQVDSLPRTSSNTISSKSNIAFITTFDHHAVNVIDIHNLLYQQKDVYEDTKEIIFIEKNGELVAFMVDEIENIIYVESSNISKAKEYVDTIINGALIYEKKVIATINTKYISLLG